MKTARVYTRALLATNVFSLFMSAMVAYILTSPLQATAIIFSKDEPRCGNNKIGFGRLRKTVARTQQGLLYKYYFFYSRPLVFFIYICYTGSQLQN